MIRRSILAVSVPVLAAAATAVQALPPIPSESGFAGYINLGVGAGSMENNMVNGIGSVDLGNQRISSLDQSPDSKDFVLPLPYFELTYTLADMRTQFYLGNQEDDSLSFELETTLETQLGIRQEIAGVGTFGLAIVKSPVATDVWKDPYLVGEKRGDTERTTQGIAVTWDAIFELPIELRWVQREIEIDDEESGASLDLTAKQQDLLRRTGNVSHVDLDYSWKLDERNELVPGIVYLKYDLDGDAMSREGPGVQLKYAYKADTWHLASRIYYQYLESDRNNPIYHKQWDVNALGASVTGFYPKPFGLRHWTANATAAVYQEDSNIDFYDTSLWLVSVGMLYRFD